MQWIVFETTHAHTLAYNTSIQIYLFHETACPLGKNKRKYGRNDDNNSQNKREHF